MNQEQLAYARLTSRILQDYDDLAIVVRKMGNDPLDMLPESYKRTMELENAKGTAETQPQIAAPKPPARRATTTAPRPTPVSRPAPTPAQAPTEPVDNRPARDRLLEEIRRRPGRHAAQLAEACGISTDNAATTLKSMLDAQPPIISRRGERGRGNNPGYTYWPALPPIQRPDTTP